MCWKPGSMDDKSTTKICYYESNKFVLYHNSSTNTNLKFEIFTSFQKNCIFPQKNKKLMSDEWNLLKIIGFFII